MYLPLHDAFTARYNGCGRSLRLHARGWTISTHTAPVPWCKGGRDQTYHWPLVLWLAHSAGPGVLLLPMGLGDQEDPWGLACLVPRASLAAPVVQAPRAPQQCLVVPGSQEGPGGRGPHPCLVGLVGLGPHWVPEGQASPGTHGSLWGPVSLWSLCCRALQGDRRALLGPSHQQGRVDQAPPSLLSVPCCQWAQGGPAVLCHLSDP